MKNKINKFINDFSNFKPPKILVFLLILMFTIIPSFSFFAVMDNDFWFLINTGKYILNNGFPVIEPFTIHPEFNFVAQQWLTDIIFYLIYDKLGVYGMFIFVTLCDILIAIIIYNLSMLVSENKIKISLFLTIIINLFLGIFFITTRPQLFDIILLLTELYLLELYIKTSNKLILIGLPIVSFLMINLHSALWLMIFVFLLPYYVEKIFKRDKENYNLKPLMVATIIMLFMGIINPYGIEAIKYLFGSYGIPEINSFIGEMKPITISRYLFIFIFMFIGLYSYYYNKSNNKSRYFLLYMGTCYLGLSHHKGLLFFFICAILSYSYNFRDIFKEKFKQKTWYKEKIINIFLIFIFFTSLVIYSYNLFNTDLKEKNESYLKEIGNFLDNDINIENKFNIKLYTGYDDGGYLEYRGYKCYIDPRAEVFLKANNKKEDVFIEYHKLQTNQLSFEKFFEKYNFDYLVVNEDDVLFDNIKEEDYEIVYEKEDSKAKIKYRIYKKKDL